MFVSWATAAKVTAGMSSINDVTSPRFTYGDNMESFTFAETFKWVGVARFDVETDGGRYHYLLQSEPELMSLDDYVLNTGQSAWPCHPPQIRSSSGRRARR